MLHTKFQGHRSVGSGEEDFQRFLPYMGMVATLIETILVCTRGHNASRSYVYWFWRRNFLRFLPYMGMGAILVM